MMTYQRAITGLGVLLGIKAGVFLVLAAFEMTAVPALILAGLAATWLALGLMLIMLAQRVAQHAAQSRVRPQANPARRLDRIARQAAAEIVPELGRAE